MESKTDREMRRKKDGDRFRQELDAEPRSWCFTHTDKNNVSEKKNLDRWSVTTGSAYF